MPRSVANASAINEAYASSGFTPTMANSAAHTTSANSTAPTAADVTAKRDWRGSRRRSMAKGMRRLRFCQIATRHQQANAFAQPRAGIVGQHLDDAALVHHCDPV